MGTKTIGSTSTPSSSEVWDSGAATWMSKTTAGMTEAGYIDKIYVYCGHHNTGNANFVFAVYDGSSNLVAQTPSGSFGQGVGWNAGTFALNSTNNQTSYPAPGGQNNSPYLFLWTTYTFHGGVWCSDAMNLECFSTGGYYHLSGSSIASGMGSASLNPFTPAGDMGWYATYFPCASISSLTSTPVGVGQQFTITGVSFSAGVNSISVNGTACSTWTVNSDTQVTATVPAGATTGPVSVDTKAGKCTSSGNLSIATIRLYRSGWVQAQAINARRSSAWTQASGIALRRNGWASSQ